MESSNGSTTNIGYSVALSPGSTLSAARMGRSGGGAAGLAGALGPRLTAVSTMGDGTFSASVGLAAIASCERNRSELLKPHST